MRQPDHAHCRSYVWTMSAHPDILWCCTQWDQVLAELECQGSSRKAQVLQTGWQFSCCCTSASVARHQSCNHPKSPSPHLQSSKTARHHSCNHPKKPSASSGACISATLTAMPYLTIHCPLPGIVSAPFLQWQEHLPLCLGCCLPSSSGAEQCLSPAARLCCHLAPPAPAQAVCWLRIFRSKAGLHDNMNPSVHCVVHELPMHFEKLTHKALHVLKHITHFVTDHR